MYLVIVESVNDSAIRPVPASIAAAVATLPDIRAQHQRFETIGNSSFLSIYVCKTSAAAIAIASAIRANHSNWKGGGNLTANNGAVRIGILVRNGEFHAY
jgi:hypothetical protein